MLPANKILAITAIFALSLTACDKKEPAKTETSATATGTTTTITTTESTTAPAVVSSPTVTSSPAIASSTAQSSATTTQAMPTPAPTNPPSVTFPATNNAKSIVTQAVKAGTPEATVKNAMDAMMNGTAKEASRYYQVDIPDFDKVLAEQQPQVQQQLKQLSLEPTIYNKDKTKAFIVGKMTTNASPTPQTMSYKLVKVKNEWKLVP